MPIDVISCKKITTDTLDIRISEETLRQIVISALVEKFPELREMDCTVGVNSSGSLKGSDYQGAYVIAKKVI